MTTAQIDAVLAEAVQPCLVAGIYPDDPTPVYSAEELEAAGQTTLDW